MIPSRRTRRSNSVTWCSVTLPPPGDADTFTFQAFAGQRITVFASGLDDGRPCIELFDPDGISIGQDCFPPPSRLNRTLTKAGVYTIIVTDDISNFPVFYVLALERTSPPSPSAIPIGPGQVLDGAIEPIGDVDLFFFAGSAGDTITAIAEKQSGGFPCIELFDPDGLTIQGPTCLIAQINRSLTKTGLHAILVWESWNIDIRAGKIFDAMDYRVSLQCTGVCPPTPTTAIAIDDVSVPEGNAVGPATFAVTLSGASADVITVDYVTADGTATAPSDYTATTGTLTFTPGVTSQTVLVSIVADGSAELDETFVVTLSNPINATIATGQAVGTIVNDDVPILTIGDESVDEGSAVGPAIFVVTLSSASPLTVTVDFTTADETATTPSDYAATTGTATFAPGVTSQVALVPIVGDAIVEADETFVLSLSNSVNATIGDGQGLGTILNDDAIDDLTLDFGAAFGTWVLYNNGATAPLGNGYAPM